MTAAAASAPFCAALLLLAAAGATGSGILGSSKCHSNIFGNINTIMATVGPYDTIPLVIDYFTAQNPIGFFSGCSVRDLFLGVFDSVYLRLYYGPSPDDYVSTPLAGGASLAASQHFDSSRGVAVYTFGYSSDPDQETTRKVVQALVARDAYNVVLVDWSQHAGQPYGVAVDLLEGLAHKVAAGINSLLGASGAGLCFVAGHGLGGRLAGAVAGGLQALGRTVPYALALDPTGALYDGSLWRCGAEGDGAPLVVLHSDDCGVGSADASGDAHVFLNSGRHRQPECPDDGYDWFGTPKGACSHERAALFFAEAVRGDVGAPVRKCRSWRDFAAGACVQNEMRLFPEDMAGASGNFYIDTTA